MTLIVFLVGMLVSSTLTLTVLKYLEPVEEVKPEPQPEPKKLSPRERRRLRRQRDPITGE